MRDITSYYIIMYICMYIRMYIRKFNYNKVYDADIRVHCNYKINNYCKGLTQFTKYVVDCIKLLIKLMVTICDILLHKKINL